MYVGHSQSGAGQAEQRYDAVARHARLRLKTDALERTVEDPTRTRAVEQNDR
jgi:hypothetical protein